MEDVMQPSPEVIASMVNHMLKARISSLYTWEQYAHDLYMLAISDILDEREALNVD